MTAGPGIILAGGHSLRFGGPGATPKPLVKLAGSPLVLWTAARLAAAGAARIIVLTGANHERLRAGLGMTRDHGTLLGGAGGPVPFELRPSGEDAGTAGRLQAVPRPELARGALLSYTDVFTNAPLADLPRARICADAALAMLTVTPTLPWGVVSSRDGQVCAFAEKPRATGTRINAGIMSLGADILKFIHDPREMLEAEPMARMVANRRVVAVPWDGTWLSIDSPKELRSAETDATALFDTRQPPRLQDAP